MSSPVLQVNCLGKSFRIPAGRRDGGESHDPRRERLSRRHDRFHALRNITFEVAKGETLGIVGHNGSGKSTLLRILAGVMTAETGNFAAQGRIGALLELGAGFHPDLTGVENVHLNGALLGLSPREITRLLPEVIGFAELERFMDMPVRHYSSGMQSRLGFAVATRLAPEILMMDETFATGDARFQARALAHVADMKRAGCTLLLVSHDVELMLELADRVLWLERGEVRRLGPPREVMADYRRSQQAALRARETRRGSLGLDVLYEPVGRDEGVTIVSVAVLGGGHGTNPAGGEIALENGAALALRVRLHRQPGGVATTRRGWLHTAWASVDRGRVLAQSRTEILLNAAGGESAEQVEEEFLLDFTPWRLIEGRWQAAVAIELESAGGRVYADRRLVPDIVRTVTPNPFTIPAVAMIDGVWHADA